MAMWMVSSRKATIHATVLSQSAFAQLVLGLAEICHHLPQPKGERFDAHSPAAALVALWLGYLSSGLSRQLSLAT